MDGNDQRFSSLIVCMFLASGRGRRMNTLAQSLSLSAGWLARKAVGRTLMRALYPYGRRHEEKYLRATICIGRILSAQPISFPIKDS